MMQVFDREVNEALVISENLSVTVLEIQSDFVRLGIAERGCDPEYREETIYLESARSENELEYAVG